MSIPVYILSGFLGSGKTTLLLNMLTETARRGLKPGILMNELGREDVDGAIVQEKISLPVQKLLDGCICCSKRSEVEGCLAQLAAGQPDVIFIELTGVADPAELRAMFHEPNEALPPELYLERVISVVDSSRFLEYNSRFSSDKQLVRMIRSQISTADLILMNKSDLTSGSELARVRRAVRKLNSTAAQLPTIRCAMDMASLLHSVHRRAAMLGQSVDDAAGPSSSPPDAPGPFRISSVSAHAQPHQHRENPENTVAAGVRSITLPVPADAQLTTGKVETYLELYRSTLLRAKGYINIGGETRLLQFSGGELEWTSSSYPGKPYLVLIGTGLPSESMEQEWKNLLATS